MKKIFSAVIVLTLLLMCASCAPSPVFKISDTLNEADYSVTPVETDGKGTTVYITTVNTVTDLSVNVMSYDWDSGDYTLKKTVLNKPSFEKNEALKVTLDMTPSQVPDHIKEKNPNFQAEYIPHVMIKYTKSDGTVFEQYIYKNSYDGKLWLLERDN